MSSPDTTEAEAEAVQEVIRSGHLSIGMRISAFEDSCATACEVKHGVGVSSGTSGLHIATIAADLGPGDLAITTAFSFVASANCLLYERAVPVFVDVDPVTGNIDAGLVQEAAEALASGAAAAARWLPPSLRSDTPAPGTLKALLPVHVFGQPADMTALCGTASRHKMAVIEDACEAIGAEHRGRKAGGMGDVGILAFYPNKQVTTGEGGMLVTDRDDWAHLFRSLRNQGRDVFDAWLNHSRLGYNYRLDEMSAALGVVQMQRLDELLDKRARVAGWYTDRFSKHGDLVETPTVVPDTTRMSWFVYVVRLPARADRSAVMAALQTFGIPTRPYFMPIHLQPFYRERFGWKPGDLPVTEDLARRSMALPFSGVMTEDQVDYVCRHVISAIKLVCHTA